jgi:hypothetical protein
LGKHQRRKKLFKKELVQEPEAEPVVEETPEEKEIVQEPESEPVVEETPEEKENVQKPESEPTVEEAPKEKEIVLEPESEPAVEETPKEKEIVLGPESEPTVEETPEAKEFIQEPDSEPVVEKKAEEKEMVQEPESEPEVEKKAEEEEVVHVSEPDETPEEKEIFREPESEHAVEEKPVEEEIIVEEESGSAVEEKEITETQELEPAVVESEVIYSKEERVITEYSSRVIERVTFSTTYKEEVGEHTFRDGKPFILDEEVERGERLTQKPDTKPVAERVIEAPELDSVVEETPKKAEIVKEQEAEPVLEEMPVELEIVQESEAESLEQFESVVEERPDEQQFEQKTMEAPEKAEVVDQQESEPVEETTKEKAVDKESFKTEKSSVEESEVVYSKEERIVTEYSSRVIETVTFSTTYQEEIGEHTFEDDQPFILDDEVERGERITEEPENEALIVDEPDAEAVAIKPGVQHEVETEREHDTKAEVQEPETEAHVAEPDPITEDKTEDITEHSSRIIETVTYSESFLEEVGVEQFEDKDFEAFVFDDDVERGEKFASKLPTSPQELSPSRPMELEMPKEETESEPELEMDPIAFDTVIVSKKASLTSPGDKIQKITSPVDAKSLSQKDSPISPVHNGDVFEDMCDELDKSSKIDDDIAVERTEMIIQSPERTLMVSHQTFVYSEEKTETRETTVLTERSEILVDDSDKAAELVSPTKLEQLETATPAEGEEPEKSDTKGETDLQPLTTKLSTKTGTCTLQL